MRVVGYVREAPGPEGGETVFAQSEQIRRWVSANGYQLIAMCQDPRASDHPAEREGYRALLGILDTDQADVVVVSSLVALSADKIDQEILLADLRDRGASVAATDDGDLSALGEPSSDPARRFIRDVLRKREGYGDLLRSSSEDQDAPEVLVELVSPNPEGDRTGGKSEAS